MHPDVNDPIVLRDHAGRGHRSRVEDIGEDLMVVAQPLDLPAGETFGTGTELSVAWPDARGIAVLPTRILAAHAEGTLRLWSLVVTGPAYVEQRRRFVRVPATGPVALLPAAGSETEAVAGSLIEVSEGAVRCTVAAGAADCFLAGRNEVSAEFRFGNGDFAVPGRVEFLRPTSQPAELEEIVVVFDEPVASADALRKQIFGQERRTLRAGKRGGRR
jgi:hypothetical protein